MFIVDVIMYKSEVQLRFYIFIGVIKSCFLLQRLPSLRTLNREEICVQIMRRGATPRQTGIFPKLLHDFLQQQL